MLFCIRELRYVAQLLGIVLSACWNVAVIMLIVLLISSKGGHVNERSYLRFVIQRLWDLIYVPSLRPHAVLALDTGQPTILSGVTLLPLRIQLSSRGRWTSTMWEYHVAPGRKFYEHTPERHYEIGYLLQRLAVEHQKKNNCASTGLIGRIIVLSSFTY